MANTLTSAWRFIGISGIRHIQPDNLVRHILRRIFPIGLNTGHPNANKVGTALHHLSLVVLLVLTTVSATPLHASGDENKKWSFHFSNASISDVINELTLTTGVYIFSNHLPSDKTVNKHYENQTIDEIVKDLFKELSTGLVWHHGEEGIDALDIWVFDRTSGQPGGFSRIERPESPSPSLPWKIEIPAPEEKEDDTEDTEEPDGDVDESPSQPPEPDEEREDDAGSDQDSGSESDVVEEMEPQEKSHEETEGEAAISIKTPEIE